MIAVAEEARLRPIPVVSALRSGAAIALPVVRDAPDTLRLVPRARAADALT